MILSTHGIIKRNTAASSYTSDFLAATGITDTTIVSALTTMESDLVGAGLISYASPSTNKIKVLYPFVGGSASLHKWNFLDPRDLDAAYRLVFYGGWTHASTGATPNGTNGYADTFWIPSSKLSSVNGGGLGHYSGTTGTTTGAFGCQNTGAGNYFRIYPTDGGTLGIYCHDLASTSPSNTNRSGFIGGSRNGATSKHINLRGTNTDSTEATTGSLVTCSAYLGAVNRDGTTTASYMSSELRAAYFDSGLSSTELGNLKTALQTFETTLGRQI